ncbi:hypothetical protein J4434_07960 [Candidatus Woesearchaeota archaeon]|nr:hypothetical protein [Candidatus Woesearchaeota archaeon]
MSGEKRESQLRESKLKEVFGSEHFTELDLSRVLNLSQSTAHYTTHKLLTQKKIARIAKGRYVFHDEITKRNKEIYEKGVYEKDLNAPLIKYIQTSLLFLHKKFRITSASFFKRSYPLSNYIIIYVEKGASEQFSSYLSSLPLKFVVLVEPKIEDIALLIDKANLHNFIILRENNYSLSETGECSLENAFVDYYFEITRKKLPVENKTEEILDYLLMHNSLNITSLLRYAKERGIKKEIEALFSNIKILKKEGDNNEQK